MHSLPRPICQPGSTDLWPPGEYEIRGPAFFQIVRFTGHILPHDAPNPIARQFIDPPVSQFADRSLIVSLFKVPRCDTRSKESRFASRLEIVRASTALVISKRIAKESRTVAESSCQKVFVVKRKRGFGGFGALYAGVATTNYRC